MEAGVSPLANKKRGTARSFVMATLTKAEPKPNRPSANLRHYDEQRPQGRTTITKALHVSIIGYRRVSHEVS